MTPYVLDTSALVTFIENEEGAAEVEALLNKAIGSETVLYISTVSCIEIFYITWQEQVKEIANRRLLLIDDLAVFQEPVNRQLITIIGEIKAKKLMSFADCCIAGLAKFMKATLVHKYPEFEQIEVEIKLLKLPYKQTSKEKKLRYFYTETHL